MPNPNGDRSCPVCASRDIRVFANAKDAEYYTSDETFTYLSCDVCRSVFLRSPPSDRLHEIYPPNYYSFQTCGKDPGLLERIKQFLDARLFRKLLADIPGDRLSVLDIGGGSGWLLSIIRKASPRVTRTHIVDIDESSRAFAESGGHVFHCCRVEDFSCDERFDLILLLNLIEHVANPGEVLCAMRKVLSPNGVILVKTPNVDTLDCRLFRNYNWGGFHCPRHFVLFNRQSFIDLGERSGLRAASATYTQGAPQWACSILGWPGLKGWLNISAERPLYRHPLYSAVSALAAVFDLLRSPFMPTAQMFVVFKSAEGATVC